MSEALTPSCSERENYFINPDFVYNQTCRLSHNIHVISNIFITFDYLSKGPRTVSYSICPNFDSLWLG